MWNFFFRPRPDSEETRERRRIDALVKATAERNDVILRRNYEMQSSYAHACRKNKVPCIDAATALLAEECRCQTSEIVNQAVLNALNALGIAVENVTGRPRPDLRADTALVDLRAMIAIAAGAGVESVARLADLDRIAEATHEAPGTRALAAHEATFIRETRGSLALEKALTKALAALQGADEKREIARTDVERVVRLRLDKAFEMGYVGSLWRGIDHLLPEGVAESRGEMPDALVNVAKKTLWV